MNILDCKPTNSQWGEKGDLAGGGLPGVGSAAALILLLYFLLQRKENGGRYFSGSPAPREDAAAHIAAQ